MPRMTGGQAVIQTLKANGVTTVFGIPGLHNLPIYDALYHERDAIRHILARHEQGAGFMANGYARSTGRPGIALVTTGPGAGNAMTALADAHRDSVPVLLVASQVASSLLGADRGAFHEMRDQCRMASGVTGFARRVTAAAEIPEALDAAWHAMTSGRPRPAYIEVPHDVLTAVADVSVPSAAVAPQIEAARDAVARACSVLQTAQRPLIYAGAGALNCERPSLLSRLARTLRAPVITTCNGKGSIPDDNPLAGGYADFALPFFRELWSEADVVLAVGTDFDQVATQDWKLPRPERLVQIDVDVSQIGKALDVDVALTGHASAVLFQLLTQLTPHPRQEHDPWTTRVTTRRREVSDRMETCAGFRLVSAINQALGPTGIATGDAARIGLWQIRYQEVYTPRTFLFPLAFGTLGFGFPAALGAQVAHPDRRVVCLCGDGGFLFTAQELATAVQHRLNVVTVVVNDGAFGSIRRLQERLYDGRVIGADLANPDFVRFAQAFGATGIRVQSVDELPEALGQAFEADAPALIEVPGPIPMPPE